ncbi:putative DNA-binding protein [Streptomyces sp. Tu6071]|nr:putative DNA-binding protein [Streptomyces sp. Tu6071]
MRPVPQRQKVGREVKSPVLPHRERRHLQHGVGKSREVEKPLILLSHALRTTNTTTQCTLVDDHEDLRRRLSLKSALPRKLTRHPFLRLLRGDGTSRHHRRLNGLGVLTGLHDPGQSTQLEDPDLNRLTLQDEVVVEAVQYRRVPQRVALLGQGITRAEHSVSTCSELGSCISRTNFDA